MLRTNPVSLRARTQVHSTFDCDAMCRKKLSEVEEGGAKAKQHEKFLAYMRKSGKNKVGSMNDLNMIIQKKLFLENFKESHRGDTMSHEPENRDDLTLGTCFFFLFKSSRFSSHSNNTKYRMPSKRKVSRRTHSGISDLYCILTMALVR